MKISYLPCLFCAVCLLVSCQMKELESSHREIITLENVPETELTMEPIASFSLGAYEFTSPDLYLIDDTLIAVIERHNASALRFYNLSGENIGRSVLRKKEDRYELSADLAMRDSFSLLHPGTNIYYEYVVEEGKLRLDEYTRMRLRENTPRHAVRLDKDHFAFIGAFKDGLFGVWHKPTRELTFFGNYPIVQEYTPSILLPYFNGRIACEGDQLVYVSYQFGFISSYKYKKGRLTRMWEKQIGDYLYKENSLGLVFDPQHKNGFLEVYFAGDHIYTLYNGCDESEGVEFTNSILVFDRAGNPVARCLLPEMISYIKIDSKGEYAYGTYAPMAQGSAEIVRFRLPEL